MFNQLKNLYVTIIWVNNNISNLFISDDKPIIKTIVNSNISTTDKGISVDIMGNSFDFTNNTYEKYHNLTIKYEKFPENMSGNVIKITAIQLPIKCKKSTAYNNSYIANKTKHFVSDITAINYDISAQDQIEKGPIDALFNELIASSHNLNAPRNKKVFYQTSSIRTESEGIVPPEKMFEWSPAVNRL